MKLTKNMHSNNRDPREVASSEDVETQVVYTHTSTTSLVGTIPEYLLLSFKIPFSIHTDHLYEYSCHVVLIVGITKNVQEELM